MKSLSQFITESKENEELLSVFSKYSDNPNKGKYGYYDCCDSYCGQLNKSNGTGSWLLADFAYAKSKKEIYITDMATKKDLEKLGAFIKDKFSDCKVLQGSYNQPNHRWSNLNEITL